MIFLFVPMLAVSTRLIPGRVVVVIDFTSTGGGVIAMGAIVRRAKKRRDRVEVRSFRIQKYKERRR